MTGRFKIIEGDGIDIANLLKKAGFAGIEGCIPFIEDLGPEGIEKVEQAFSNAGLSIHSFHLPFTSPTEHDLANLYETERKKAVDETAQWIKKAAMLGAKTGILHPTTKKGYSVKTEGFDRILDAFSRSMEELLPISAKYGMIIAAENVPSASIDRFGSSAEHIRKIRERLACPDLGFCLDTGHALISSKDPIEFYEAMGDDLIAFHLADNAGDRDSHLAPGKGLFPWKELFKRLGKNAPKRLMPGSLCVETPPFAPGPPYSPKAWKSLFEDANKLVRENLIAGEAAYA